LTINPSDLHDPIAQVFAGEEIDLDKFESTLGPNKDERAKNIADNPYASAKFFHFIIQTILETLLQIRITNYKVLGEMGILGRVSAYFGTVESQGRGTLHLHILIWLENTPNADEIKEMLKTEDFRAKVAAYIRANLRAYLPGLESVESVNMIPREPEIAWSRPPDPDAEDYDRQLESMELRLARTEQIHTCKQNQCLITDKHGVHRCKRRAPFECSSEDYIDESGKWGSKRLYGYVNGWIPGILTNVRCNNDGKLLTNGENTKNITFYITMYTAKKQGKTHNLSAILAKGFTYHYNHPNPKYLNNLQDDQRLFLFRLLQAINREQEIAAPMVISYLMGWGDVYRSHTYSPIVWPSFVRALLKEFPTLSHYSRSVSLSSVALFSFLC
jgi:Helitron helicase-like domain at N-terminus